LESLRELVHTRIKFSIIALSDWDRPKAGAVPGRSGRRSRSGRGGLLAGTFLHREKAVALNAQQVLQLLIAAMKHCPPQLRLYAFALLL
jgi:hypothetical protein